MMSVTEARVQEKRPGFADGKGVGPSSIPAFAFHIVMHLKLHLAGPEEVALGMA